MGNVIKEKNAEDEDVVKQVGNMMHAAMEESSRKEAEAYFSAYVRGRGGRRSGMGGAGVRGVRRGVGGI